MSNAQTASMLDSNERPSVDVLSRLSTLSDLDKDQLRQLADKLVISQAPKGTRLLGLGSKDTSTLYLLEGTLQLKATDGAVQVMTHDDPSARNPVARLRPSRYEVIAATPVRFLSIASELVASLTKPADFAFALESYEVHEETGLGELALENLLTVRLYEDLNADRLLLPSLPAVAVRVGTALSDEDSDAADVARIVETDPAIAAKLLKAANSARFGGRANIGRIEDAVVRLGMRTTHQLVLAFALRELFRSPSPDLRGEMQALWEHSRRVAALSHTLAKKVGGFDPEFALLAGLVHDIGALAVLAYAAEFTSEEIEIEPLQAAVAQLRGRIGGQLLRRWHLPTELAQVAEEAENWQRKGDAKADYADLVIVAQLHSLVGGPDEKTLPPLDKVPAHAKLGLGPLSSEAVLALLDEAAEEIRETELLLGG